MGLLNQLKRAMGLESRASSHDGLKASISFPVARPTSGNGSSSATGTANGSRANGNGHAAKTPRPGKTMRPASANGRAAVAEAQPTAIAANADQTQAIQSVGLETSVELPTANHVAAEAVAAEIQRPPAPVEVVSLQFGLDDASLYEFDDDDEETAELLEDGNCRRCWIEDHTEVQVPVDTHSRLRICPECKATYRAAES